MEIIISRVIFENVLISESIQPPIFAVHQNRIIINKIFLSTKLNTGKDLEKNKLMFRASYYKKYGIMCCIVLKSYYLCIRKQG